MKHIINYITTLELAHKEYLWLLLIVIPVIAWYIWKHVKTHASLNVSTLQPYMPQSKHNALILHLPFALRILIIVLTVFVLAQPQSSMSHKQVNVEGIDITIALDVSGSMLAMDFKPNRLEACKSVIRTFVENRPTDRMGLVLYAGEAYTKCPLTTDHSTLLMSLDNSDNNQIDDGTAIGDGLGTAINRLRESQAKSKVIILLSDGVNNSGYIDPLSAADLAKEFGIRVYTIGCGSMGEAPYKTPYGTFYAKTEIDENLLRNIASVTGGKYFRAQNKEKLKAVYEEIDQMEKSKISETQFTNKNDAFFPFLLIALLLFVLELILSQTILKIHP